MFITFIAVVMERNEWKSYLAGKCILILHPVALVAMVTIIDIVKKKIS
jgi:hypothetical protein